MKKTDMELQAIRDKLKQLESEPSTGDVLSMPWSSPQAPFSSAMHPAPRPTAKTTTPSADKTPQAAVMATLRQRSSHQPHPQTASKDARQAQVLVTQEIAKLEVHARNINQRSQEQAAEILAMKRSAQQAAIALGRQGIDHPQFNTIAHFLEQYPSVNLPQLERNSQGHFTLSHTTVNLHHAKEEALNTANKLRNLRTGHSPSAQAWSASPVPFSQPIEPGPSVEEYLEETTLPIKKVRRSPAKKKYSSAVLKLMHQLKKRQQHVFKQPVLAGSLTPSSLAPSSPEPLAISDAPTQRPSFKPFSWTDGAIWFSAAAIARIVLEAIIVSYPPTRMPLMIVLFTLISFSIYRVFISKSTDPTPAYRLGVVLLGLFLGSAF